MINLIETCSQQRMKVCFVWTVHFGYIGPPLSGHYGWFPEKISNKHFALLQTFWIQRHFTIIYSLPQQLLISPKFNANI